jgi:hypothetical protein
MSLLQVFRGRDGLPMYGLSSASTELLIAFSWEKTHKGCSWNSPRTGAAEDRCLGSLQ